MSSATISDVKHCYRCKTVKPISEFTAHAWCTPCKREYNQSYERKYWKKYTKEQIREQNLRKKFGVTIEECDIQLQSQGGRCAICHSTNPGNGLRNFTIDHDHRTGKLRGLLCRPCNMGIGLLGDSIANLMQAADYIYEYKMGMR